MLVNKGKQYIGWAEPTGDDFFINLYNNYTGAGFPMNVAWCAIYVTDIARLCGVGTDIVPNFADCDAGVRWFKDRGRWENSKSQGGNYVPKRNDVVFYSNGHTQRDSTHVGYVVSVSGNTMKALEGNKSNAVGYRTISLSDSYIIGYGRVSAYLSDSSDKGEDYSSLEKYTVKKGDTLSEIAKAMGVSTSELASYNGIKDANKINVGQVIKNPKKASNSNNNSNKNMNTIVRDGQIHANNFCGAKLEVDGIIGTETKKARTKVFQMAMNLDYKAGLGVDGIPGTKTYAALGNHYVKKGEKQYMVTAVEIALMLHGYNPNGVENPGTFGSGLEACVKQFQKDHGLTVDGVAGRNTIIKLMTA